MVSTTASQSTGAVKPGPTAMTTGAISRVVPKLRFGQNRVDHGSGFKLIEHLGLGVHHNGNIPASVISSASAGVCAKRARMPSTWTSPKRMASQKTDCATDARGDRDIGHDDRHAGAHQASGDARGDIAGAANINEHSLGTSLCYGLGRAKAVRPLL